MRLVARILCVFAALALLAGVVAGGGMWWLRESQPAYSGVVESVPVGSPVRVLFDELAVPHVFADGWNDAYFTIGYLHARDRLWQMEMQRRVGQGRVAEILGNRASDLDRFMRTLGLYHAAENSLRALSGETRQALQSYARGVNQYLDNREEPLPLEFQLTLHEPEPWQPADSVVWTKTMALILSGNYRKELLLAQLLSRLAPEQVMELFPGYRPDDPVTLPGQTSPDPPPAPPRPSPHPSALGSARLYVHEEIDELWPLGRVRPGGTIASNHWVVAGHYTESGAPILANDPHLALDAPSLWYLVRLEVGDRGVAGATVPGVPFHILGQNDSLAWGMTNTGSDVQDLVLERLKPGDPTQYLARGEWTAIAERREVIRVRFKEAIAHPVRSTRHGPLLSDVSPVAATVAGSGYVLALSFTALQGEDRTLDAVRELNVSRTWKEARDALEMVAAPQQNFVIADTEGSIGFIAPARVPIRDGYDGRLPVLGEIHDTLWMGDIPYEELPTASNPLQGWIANANNAVVDGGYPYVLSFDWEAPYRAARIESRLMERTRSAESPFTLEDAVDMQMDTVSLAALELLPAMTGIAAIEPASAAALERLRAWTGEMDRERPEPALFYLWISELDRALFADELGSIYPAFAGVHPRTIIGVLDGLHHWCDDVRTSTPVETCEQMLERSLSRAVAQGRALYGDDIETWRWGRLHRAPLRHALLGRLPGFRELFDIGIETGGGNYTLNRGATFVGATAEPGGQPPFSHVHGPGYRAVYDLKNPERSRFVISTGQSGNPLSRHYGDQVQPWRDGHYFPLFAEPEILLAKARGVLELKPREPTDKP